MKQNSCTYSNADLSLAYPGDQKLVQIHYCTINANLYKVHCEANFQQFRKWSVPWQQPSDQKLVQITTVPLQMVSPMAQFGSSEQKNKQSDHHSSNNTIHSFVLSTNVPTNHWQKFSKSVLSSKSAPD